MEVSVSEIHGYPARPEGFIEPLFPTAESRCEIAEHLLRAPWLSRASEMPEKSGSTAHIVEEPVQINRCGNRCGGGRVEIVRTGGTGGTGARRCSWRRRRVVEVLARWREVRSWWSDEERVDRMLFRVVVDGHSPLGPGPLGHSPLGGAIVDLALERSGSCSGEWTLVGIVD